MNFRSVTVCPVRSLEINDLIAFELIGSICSGKITGIAYYVSDLTNDQKEYLKNNYINIPKESSSVIGGENSSLLFGDFHAPGAVYKHLFLNDDTNVAVFPINYIEKRNTK